MAKIGRPRKENKEAVASLAIPLSAKAALARVRWMRRMETGKTATYADAIKFLVDHFEQTTADSGKDQGDFDPLYARQTKVRAIASCAEETVKHHETIDTSAHTLA